MAQQEIRILAKTLQPDDVNFYGWAGSSEVDKPTYGCTGSWFLETDTGKVVFYNEITGWPTPEPSSDPVESGGDDDA